MKNITNLNINNKELWIQNLNIIKKFKTNNNFKKRIHFDIFSPWWNYTCLIKWIIKNLKLKKKINDYIMKLYPYVEQVGFIDLESEIPRLEMAWWEFCWNATRSFVSNYFNWKQWSWLFLISWISRPHKSLNKWILRSLVWDANL
jgi:hypothetical protein